MYKRVRTSFAPEHRARMKALHKATDDATELRNSLKLTYNKSSHAAITNKILEIVGGAEALNVQKKTKVFVYKISNPL